MAKAGCILVANVAFILLIRAQIISAGTRGQKRQVTNTPAILTQAPWKQKGNGPIDLQRQQIEVGFQVQNKTLRGISGYYAGAPWGKFLSSGISSNFDGR